MSPSWAAAADRARRRSPSQGESWCGVAFALRRARRAPSGRWVQAWGEPVWGPSVRQAQPASAELGHQLARADLMVFRTADGVRPGASPRAARDGVFRLPRPAGPLAAELDDLRVSHRRLHRRTRRPRTLSASLDLVERRRDPNRVQQTRSRHPDELLQRLPAGVLRLEADAVDLRRCGGEPRGGHCPAVRQRVHHVGREVTQAGPAESGRRRSARRSGARRYSVAPSSGSPGSA